MTEIPNKPLKINIYGRQPVFEALRFNCKVLDVQIAKGLTGKTIKQIIETAKKNDTAITYVDKNDIQKMVGPVVHQGIAASVLYDNFVDEQSLPAFLKSCANPFIVILDQIQDPHNLGAILRTTEITNTDLIVLPLKGSAPLNATVAKTSAGALFGVKIHQTEDLSSFIEQLKMTGITIFAAIVSTKQSIFKVNFRNPSAIVIGSEDKGVRKNIQTLCDELIMIPQMGKLNSLNASVSTAIIMYEVIRQRHFTG